VKRISEGETNVLALLSASDNYSSANLRARKTSKLPTLDVLVSSSRQPPRHLSLLKTRTLIATDRYFDGLTFLALLGATRSAF
jgi:hypothetical protein